MNPKQLVSVGLLSAAISVFVAGITAYRFLESMIEERLKPVIEKLETAAEAATRANGRLDGIRMVFGSEFKGDEYGCGQNDKAKADNQVMIGLRDGTGCGVTNENSYRSISLEVPR